MGEALPYTPADVNRILDRAIFKGLEYRNECSMLLVFEQQGKTYELELWAEDRVEDYPDLHISFLRERK